MLCINLISLLICLPIILIFVFLIYFEDKANPIYSGLRVGKNFKLFTLYKLRSMILRENVGFQSTSINDKRILKIGKIIRSTKIDELPQIFNVIKGDINFVGPRPNVKEEVDKYIETEKKILDYKPGITDFSSIIFSDEGEILKDSKDPDLDYNLLIRPRKNLIAVLYFKDRSILIDVYIIFLTILNILNRELTLKLIYKYLNKKYNKHDLNFILRKKPLTKIQNINKYFKTI
jgi:lipopolysaccharide/colanic/teichoic acid biosynthesis glycosyltransferase